MPLTFNFRLALKKTAGRKSGDETGPMNLLNKDHRVTSKPQ